VEAELAATLDGLRLPAAPPPAAASSPGAETAVAADASASEGPAAVPDDALPTITLDAHWQRDGSGGWQAWLQSPREEGLPALLTARRAADGRLALEAADWPLEPLARVAAELPQTSPGLAAWLRAAAPRGELRGLQLVADQDRIERIDARIDALGFAPAGAAPGVSGLSLGLTGDADVVDVELRGSPLTIDWPDALLSPLQPMLQGRLQLFRDDGVAAIEIGALQLREADYGIDVAGGLRFDGGRPSATLRADVAAAPIVVAKRFWIRHRMPPNTVAWLDRAIEDGRLEGGRALINGDLDDWPFTGHQGRFEAEARIADTRLKFHPGWPEAEQLAGVARFINNSMSVEVRGSLRGLDATKAVGSIAEFGRPLLDLSIDGHASGPVMLDLLRHSPLQATHGEHLDALTIGGRGDADIDLAIPLRPDLGTTRVRGSVRLHDAELADSRWGLAFEDADGEVRFSERGLLADPLQLRYGGQPAQFGLAIGSFTRRPSNIVEARLSGRFEADTLLAAAPSIDWLRPFWSGRSDWWLELDVPQPERALAPSLRVRSDLVGTRIALPAPLAKADAVQMPLELLYDLPVAASPAVPATAADAAVPAGAASPGRLELRLGELMRLYGRLGDDGRLDGVAAFGGAVGAERPERGLRVIGQVPVLDLGGWAGLALATDNGGDGLLAGVDLSAGQIDLLDRAFAETSLTFDRDADGSARLQVGGDVIQGTVELPPPALQATRGITGRFERVYWPEAQPGAASLSLADPASLPPLHVWVGDLRLGDAHLGEARLESFAVEQGMRVERFETRSPALELFARGDWVRSGLSQRSDFSIEFTAPDLGGMLRALGFEALIDGGQTLARLQAHWPGAPSSFSLDAVDGWLEVSVGKGRIPKVDPGGVGRMFGLLSLSEIPRRLALDFSDFFRSGLAFNRIEGRFTLDDGDALTDNLLIDGPAAEIRIKGRTGLEARDYEQTMEVLPRAGNVLPVVGALAGGPAGAAIGAVAQAMLSKPFKQMTRTLYRVDGSWDDPRIEVLERGPARPPEVTAGAGDGPPAP